jgi:hypothetical protein
MSPVAFRVLLRAASAAFLVVVTRGRVVSFPRPPTHACLTFPCCTCLPGRSYDGVKSTAKAFVRLKAQALLEMSHQHEEGRSYHRWKNDEKLTAEALRRREWQQDEARRAEAERAELAEASLPWDSEFASLVPTQRILHPLERMEADDHLVALWPAELHEAMAASATGGGGGGGGGGSSAIGGARY